MGSLIMDSADLRGAGSNIKNNSDEFISLISQFYSDVASITATDVWSGEEDSMTFSNVAEGMKSDLQNISSIMREVGENFVSTASSYESTVEENANRINQVI